MKVFINVIRQYKDRVSGDIVTVDINKENAYFPHPNGYFDINLNICTILRFIVPEISNFTYPLSKESKPADHTSTSSFSYF